MFDTERFARGDREHFKEIMQSYSRVVILVCRAFAVDQDHEEDLFQETWKTVYARRASYSGSGSFEPWLHRVATNVCLDDHRARRISGAALQRYVRETGSATRHGLDPLASTERSELRRALHQALSRLPEAQQAAIMYRVLDGLSTEEVAARMGIRPATVRSHIRHGIKRLRTLMEDPENGLSRYRSAH